MSPCDIEVCFCDEYLRCKRAYNGGFHFTDLEGTADMERKKRAMRKARTDALMHCPYRENKSGEVCVPWVEEAIARWFNRETRQKLQAGMKEMKRMGGLVTLLPAKQL